MTRARLQEVSKERKEIIFVSSIHRSSERVIEGLVPLKKDFKVKIFNISQASKDTAYEGNRKYLNRQLKIFKEENIFNCTGLKNYSDRLSAAYSKKVCDQLLSLLNKNTVCVIVDDTRTHKTPYIHQIYQKVKNFDNKICVIGIPEGIKPVKIIDTSYNLIASRNRCYDDLFCFGKYDYDYVVSDNKISEDKAHIVGMPENDSIFEIIEKNQNREDYILYIVNFLESYEHKFFDTAKASPTNIDTLKMTNVINLQKKMNKKIVFKIKDRMNERLDKSVNYLRSIIPANTDYEIVTHVDSDISLIKDAAFILSYGSSMMIKALMMKKPTVIFREFGHVGMFDKYFGTISLGQEYEKLFESDYEDKQHNFLVKTLGFENYYNSKSLFSNAVIKAINERQKCHT